jgi:hypothetical protein
MNIEAFLMDRINEAEIAARLVRAQERTAVGDFSHLTVGYSWFMEVMKTATGSRQAGMPTKGAPSPNFVLADCVAKRKIIGAYLDRKRWGHQGGTALNAELDAYLYVLHCLVIPWAGHPDYDRSWGTVEDTAEEGIILAFRAPMPAVPVPREAIE